MSARRHRPIVKIASGGTAAVWVGAGDDGAVVAIKRPHAHLADDPAFRRSLASEATIASRLRHPNVVDVRAVEQDEDGIQLVMRYVEGPSLSELIRSWSREPPPRPEACALRVVLDTCAGLHALHELASDTGAPLGLVHRDVSPANVLVGKDGVACIADFGLAKSLYAVERTTSEGALRGKLGYMAPEYIRGGKAIDRRIDVFAMAVVAWEALARKRLFRGENDGQTLERVQRMHAPQLAETVPGLGAAGPAIDAVLARALAKEPEARTRSVADLAGELEDVAHAHGLTATHAEVAASFGPTLAAQLEDRRARVAAAVDGSPAGTASAVASGATLAGDAPRRRSRARLAWFAVPAATLALGAAIATRLRAPGREPPPLSVVEAPAAPEPPASVVAPSSASASAPAPVAVTPAAPSADRPKGRATSPASATRAAPPPSASSSPPPGLKKPRPNPYGAP